MVVNVGDCDIFEMFLSDFWLLICLCSDPAYALAAAQIHPATLQNLHPGALTASSTSSAAAAISAAANAAAIAAANAANAQPEVVAHKRPRLDLNSAHPHASSSAGTSSAGGSGSASITAPLRIDTRDQAVKVSWRYQIGLFKIPQNNYEKRHNYFWVILFMEKTYLAHAESNNAFRRKVIIFANFYFLPHLRFWLFSSVAAAFRTFVLLRVQTTITILVISVMRSR